MMQEVLEDGDVVGTMEFSVQLDFLVSEDAAKFVLGLGLLSTLALVLA